MNSDDEVRTGIVNAFKELLFDLGVWRASPEGLSFSRLGELEATRFELPFTEEEVHSTFLNGDNTLVPDGFTAAFWQFNWDIVKFDIMDLFKDLHERGRFGRSLNSTFLVLIPKKRGG